MVYRLTNPILVVVAEKSICFAATHTALALPKHCFGAHSHMAAQQIHGLVLPAWKYATGNSDTNTTYAENNITNGIYSTIFGKRASCFVYRQIELYSKQYSWLRLKRRFCSVTTIYMMMIISVFVGYLSLVHWHGPDLISPCIQETCRCNRSFAAIPVAAAASASVDLGGRLCSGLPFTETLSASDFFGGALSPSGDGYLVVLISWEKENILIQSGENN